MEKKKKTSFLKNTAKVGSNHMFNIHLLLIQCFTTNSSKASENGNNFPMQVGKREENIEGPEEDQQNLTREEKVTLGQEMFLSQFLSTEDWGILLAKNCMYQNTVFYV